MIIDHTYFTKGLTQVPGIEIENDGTPSIVAKSRIDMIEDYIRVYEPKYLKAMGMTVEQGELWLISTDKISPLADYVFYFYARDNAQEFAQSVNLNVTQRLISAWNDGVERNIALVAEHTLLVDLTSPIFCQITSFDI